METVRLEKVTRIYRQAAAGVRALDQVSFAVRKGEFTALCGPSGSGKTTLLNLIGCLDRPDSGRILFSGRDLASMSRAELARMRRDRIGFVFQAHNLIPVLTVAENAGFVLELQGMAGSAVRQRVEEVLAEVGLEGLGRRFPADLSGGQQQRVAIARALAPRPELILADEPTASVDSVTAGGLLDLMEELNRGHGITFLFSTHDERVMRRARRLIRLRDGRLEEGEGA